MLRLAVSDTWGFASAFMPVKGFAEAALIPEIKSRKPWKRAMQKGAINHQKLSQHQKPINTGKPSMSLCIIEMKFFPSKNLLPAKWKAVYKFDRIIFIVCTILMVAKRAADHYQYWRVALNHKLVRYSCNKNKWTLTNIDLASVRNSCILNHEFDIADTITLQNRWDKKIVCNVC